jgi:hypothetical protein
VPVVVAFANGYLWISKSGGIPNDPVARVSTGGR